MTKFDNNISFVKLTYLDIEQRILLKTQNKSENTKTIGKSYYLMLAIPTATAGSNNNITLSSGVPLNSLQKYTNRQSRSLKLD